MPQKEDSPETIEVLQDEVSPQVNGEEEEEKSVSADKTASIEEKASEEKATESNEVGFKKIFRFVGFKFTLKKDKNEKTEPVQLLTVKETEDGATEAAAEESKEEAITVESKPEDENAPEAPEKEKESTTEDAVEPEAATALPATEAPAETVAESAAEPEQQPAEEVAAAPEKEPSEEEITAAEKEKEPETQTESPTSPPSQETQSPFKRFFTQGIFSNLRKKTSFKKSKDQEPTKEKPHEEDIKEDEEKAEEAVAEDKDVKEEAPEGATEEQAEESTATAEIKVEAVAEESPFTAEEQTAEEPKVQVEATSESEPTQETETVAQAAASEVEEVPAAETTDEAKPTDDTKPADDKPTESTEEQHISESAAEPTTEPEAVSSQDKSKAQGSPLKKLFTGAGLKKLSSKKQKGKKEAESKPAESGEQVVEQIQSSTESAEPPKPDSGPSSPEESGEHVVGEASQPEDNVEGEAVASDSEKKKDGILPWASFKKLVTPKKRVKRSSESEDEAPGDKPKSATLSSTESAALEDKPEETKASDETKDELKEESQAESKAETKAEKLEQSSEEPKKKMDTSVSWEALICVGSSKKRARKTSDSDDEETKIEEEVQQSGEQQEKTTESPLGSSHEADHENLASSPEPEGELVSTWESFKRLVTHRKKPKAEDKSDEASGPEQTTSDSEIPKEESSFSFRKLIPRRKKKSDAKQGPSSDVGSAEEDSDTPAVVPLSEYDNEQSEKVEADKKEEAKTEDETADVTPVTPGKGSTEDRSPSWISAAVENVEDEKQLSDIPEEGDTAATPKSTDNTIAEDIVEFTSEAVTALEPVEETEMVSAVSRITASPVTSGETTPVPGDEVVNKAETVLQEAVEAVSVTSAVIAGSVTEEQKNIIDQVAVKEEAMVSAAPDLKEATAVCTGLDTTEIKGITEETLLKPSVESVPAVHKALQMEVAIEDQTPKPEVAGVIEEKMFVAEVNKVQAEYQEQLQKPIENAVEETAHTEAVEEMSVSETVNEFQEATAVKVAVVTAVQQEAQILEEPLVTENSPKMETEGPVEPSVEEPVCAQTVEVTEVAVANGENVQELKDVEESVSSVEVSSVEGVTTAVSEEITPLIADTPRAKTTESKEDTIPVVAPTEESAVTEETVCASPAAVLKAEAEVEEEVVLKEVPIIEPTFDHKIQITVQDVETASAKVEVEGRTEAASSNVSAVVEEVCEKVQEDVEVAVAVGIKEAEVLQEQSAVIVQEVIQNVVENLGDLQMEQESTQKEEEKESRTMAAEEVSTAEDVPAASEKTEEQPAVLVAAEDKLSEEAPVQEDKPATDEQIQEEKPTEATSEEPQSPKPESGAEEQQTRVITEKSPAEVSEAVQISETIPVAITAEIKPEQEEVATVSEDVMQQDTDVLKREVELRNIEQKVEEEKPVAECTESEDGKCQVEEDLKKVPKEIQQETTETPEESSQTTQTATAISTKQAQMLEDQCQIETTKEIKVGIVNVVDADKGAVQNTEACVKEDSLKDQEPLEDKPQTILKEAQEDISTQDRKESQEGSGDATCQKTDAKASELKMAVEETVNAIAEEEVTEKVTNEIEPVSTELATVS